MNDTRLVIAAFGALSVALGVWLLLTARSNWNRTQELGLPVDCRAVLGWLDKSGAADGPLALPENLAEVAADRHAWLVSREEGRCVVLKRGVAGKHRYTGDLCCEEGVPAGADLAIGAPPLDALHVESRETKRWAKVSFPLAPAPGAPMAPPSPAPPAP